MKDKSSAISHLFAWTLSLGDNVDVNGDGDGNLAAQVDEVVDEESAR